MRLRSRTRSRKKAARKPRVAVTILSFSFMTTGWCEEVEEHLCPPVLLTLSSEVLTLETFHCESRLYQYHIDTELLS